MATETASTSAATPLVDQRLDEIERLLFGLLPRGERLELMSKLEEKVRAPGNGCEAVLADSPLPTPFVGRDRATASRRRSLLALTAGIVGIITMLLLCAAPLMVIFVEVFQDVVGEIGALAMVLTHGGLLAMGGFLALGLGMIALFRLLRKRGQLIGHGWAITGICTGPIPMLLGGLVVMMMGYALLESDISVTQTSSPPPQTVNAAYATAVPGTTMEPGALLLPPELANGAPQNKPMVTNPGPLPAPYQPAAVSENQPGTPPADNPTLQYAPPPASPATPPQLPEASEQAAAPQPEVKEAAVSTEPAEAKPVTKEPAGSTTGKTAVE